MRNGFTRRNACRPQSPQRTRRPARGLGRTPRPHYRALSVISIAVLAVAGCAASSPTPPTEQTGSRQNSTNHAARMTTKVNAVLPHDATAFTQGLELAGGTLYEGTGLVGRSSLTAGEPGKPPTTRVALPEPLFGEGITVVGPTVWQLTWQNGVAIQRDATTLQEQRRVSYPGEGWGLCHQSARDRLVMSDGTANLTFRRPGDFAEIGRISVVDGTEQINRLNELECVGDSIYANVWQSDEIVHIDANTGRVIARITAANLLTATERHTADTLNGIAAIPGTNEFFLTGKLWPKMFRVTFVPA